MAQRVPAHVRLFARLRPFLRADLTVSNGIPNPVAGSILNWFDPAGPEYLAHVDAWQRLLCTGASAHPIPFLTERPGDVGVYRDDMSLYMLRACHQVAKLVYKFHGEPAKKTDWGEVCNRLSHARPINLTDVEIEGIRRILSRIQPPDLNEVKGRFGPGATCEGFASEGKWRRMGLIPDVPANLFRVSPRDGYVPAGLNPFRYTKMAEVPKSIKANRTVSSEPAMSMFAQLAVNDYIVPQLHLLFPGHVSLHDQAKHNRLLVRSGMATLDLSDASDHNSCELVERVLPQLWPVLAKVRSEYTHTPNGVIHLETFAPMGSGVCFSVMTTVILGIIAYAFESLGYSWWREQWSVYGDDVIVPIWIADYVQDLLERAGFVLNRQKCCTSEGYLESCGLEVYRVNGKFYDVTPAYLKEEPEALSAEKVEQFVAKCHEFFPRTANEVARLAHPVRGVRFNRALQRQELLVSTLSARSTLSVIDGWEGLNRWFSIGSQQEVHWKGAIPLGELPGVRQEVRTKPAWRYRPASNYPHLSLLFATGVLPE